MIISLCPQGLCQIKWTMVSEKQFRYKSLDARGITHSGKMMITNWVLRDRHFYMKMPLTQRKPLSWILLFSDVCFRHTLLYAAFSCQARQLPNPKDLKTWRSFLNDLAHFLAFMTCSIRPSNTGFLDQLKGKFRTDWESGLVRDPHFTCTDSISTQMDSSWNFGQRSRSPRLCQTNLHFRCE